ncbi:MAG: murein biosynthesis integral membrane protein MurJ [Acidimicrobiia bacterium]|nr:murein biosynthesis integral membrane protein MurJ [Acidimicrobiia bacterium]
MQPFLARLRRGEIGAAAVLVGGGVLLSRVLGIIRDIVFASMLGADGVTDVYVAAFRIPDFANYLLAGGFLAITFIPIMARYLADDDEPGAWQAFTAITRWLAVAITGLIAVAWFATPAVINALYPSFDDAQIASTISLTRIVLPAQFAFVVGALFTAVQYAKGRFGIPTLAPIVYNVGIIVGGVVWAAVTGTADPSGFIWGALVGAFVGNLGIQVFGAFRAGLRIDWSTAWKHPAVLIYITIALPLMLGQSIVALDETFMSIFGAQVGDGVATQLQFARRTMFVPIGVIGQAAAVAAYPTLARLFAEGDRPGLLSTVDRSMRWVVALSIGAAGVAVAMATPIMRLLFERGAFTAESTDAAASALAVYALAIPVWGVLQIVTRAFYARRQMWTPVIVGTGATVVAIPLYWVLADRFGIEGVALASVISLTLFTITLCAIWYRPTDTRAGMRSVVRSAGRTIPLVVPAAILAGLVGWFIVAGLTGPAWVAAAFALALGGLIYGAVAVGIGGWLYDFLWARAGGRVADAAPDDTTGEVQLGG